jgi:hypothetical protein
MPPHPPPQKKVKIKNEKSDFGLSQRFFNFNFFVGILSLTQVNIFEIIVKLSTFINPIWPVAKTIFLLSGKPFIKYFDTKNYFKNLLKYI